MNLISPPRISAPHKKIPIPSRGNAFRQMTASLKIPAPSPRSPCRENFCRRSCALRLPFPPRPILRFLQKLRTENLPKNRARTFPRLTRERFLPEKLPRRKASRAMMKFPSPSRARVLFRRRDCARLRCAVTPPSTKSVRALWMQNTASSGIIHSGCLKPFKPLGISRCKEHSSCSRPPWSSSNLR